MKVVIDGRYLRQRASGIKTYTTALIDHFAGIAKNIDFEVWVHPDITRRISQSRNIQQRIVRYPANGPGTLFNTGAMGDLNACDVFHATFNILGHGVRCPTVLTVHDMRWIDNPRLCESNPILRPIRVGFMQHGIRNGLSTADRILTVSQASADLISKYAPFAESRIRITPCACDPCFEPPDSVSACRQRAAELLGCTLPYFMAVGVNARGKGHDLIIEAFAAAAERDERLVLVHRVDGAPEIERMARAMGVYERIHWLRGLSQADLVTLMQAARVFLQPSRYEGFGIPVLEAMSCGTPVIASDIPALTEVMSGAGRTVPCGKAGPLARAMRQVAGDLPLRREMRIRGLLRASEFSWVTTAERTVQAYQEAAARKPVYDNASSFLRERSAALEHEF
jgi:glycosyltransferase involved in cell wall biosynthesis